MGRPGGAATLIASFFDRTLSGSPPSNRHGARVVVAVCLGLARWIVIPYVGSVSRLLAVHIRLEQQWAHPGFPVYCAIPVPVPVPVPVPRPPRQWGWATSGIAKCWSVRRWPRNMHGRSHPDYWTGLERRASRRLMLWKQPPGFSHWTPGSTG